MDESRNTKNNPSQSVEIPIERLTKKILPSIGLEKKPSQIQEENKNETEIKISEKKYLEKCKSVKASLKNIRVHTIPQSVRSFHGKKY